MVNDTSYSTLQAILILLKYINKKRRFQLLLILILIIISAGCELFSVASIIPLLSLIIDPNLIQDIYISDFISFFYSDVSLNTITTLLAIIFGIAVVISTIIRLLNLWLNNYISSIIVNEMSVNCYSNILSQPYEFFLRSNDSNIIASITSKIDIVGVLINYLFQLIGSIVISISLIVGLFLLSWKIGLILLLGISLGYFLIFIYSKNIFLLNGKYIDMATDRQMLFLREGISNIRDILLNNLQESYIYEYSKFDLKKRIKNAFNNFLTILPRYSIEAIGLLLMVGIATFLVLKDTNKEIIISILGTVALGSQRLLPAFQQGYASWAGLRSYKYALKSVLDIIELNKVNLIESQNEDDLEFEKSINLKNIYFKYNGNKNYSLEDISLDIPKGSKVAIVGRSGSGKTSLASLIIGLIKPTKGNIFIDGKDLNSLENKNKLFFWRNNIGYVPQEINIVTGTIRENIGLRDKYKKIDNNKIIMAAKKARIHDYINSLPNGYDTLIGETGISMSGGQIQRLGIARALYYCPLILVLDEATSGLDSQTESEVVNTIRELDYSLTVLVITHKLSTIKYCTKIINLENGRISKK